MQMHVAFSETIKGASLIVSGPYGGGWFHELLNKANDLKEPQRQQKKKECMKKLIKQAEDFEQEGKIDKLSNLKNAPVFIGSGIKDIIVRPIQQEMQQEFYKKYGANVKINKHSDGDHGYVFKDPADSLNSTKFLL